MKNKKIIIISIFVILFLSYFIYNRFFPSEYVAPEDEIVLRIKLDLKEDIGLIVYDYKIEGHEYSGGMSNADKSLIRHNEELICGLIDKEHVESDADEVDIEMNFRIITEYVDPNFENVYLEEITKRLDAIKWKAIYGNIYNIIITGDKIEGYQIILE